MGENYHRVVVAVIFLITVVSMVITYVGIDTYIQSGRSVLGDARSTVKFQWKSASCDDLALGIGSSRLSEELKGAVNRVCSLAQEHSLPPFAIKSLIDGRKPKPAKGEQTSLLDEQTALALIADVTKELTDTMPKVKKRYERYRQEIMGMWFFFIFVASAGALYFYSRSFTPILFGKVKARFEKIMFGKSKYFSGWDKFLKQNRPE
jgi:hypothetical protein